MTSKHENIFALSTFFWQRKIKEQQLCQETHGSFSLSLFPLLHGFQEFKSSNMAGGRTAFHNIGDKVKASHKSTHFSLAALKCRIRAAAQHSQPPVNTLKIFLARLLCCTFPTFVYYSNLVKFKASQKSTNLSTSFYCKRVQVQN